MSCKQNSMKHVLIGNNLSLNHSVGVNTCNNIIKMKFYLIIDILQLLTLFIYATQNIYIYILVYILFSKNHRKHPNSYSTMRYLSICVLCALFMLGLLSTSSKATHQCDGQLFTKLDKIQSSINNIWKRKPKAVGKYMHITHGNIQI